MGHKYQCLASGKPEDTREKKGKKKTCNLETSDARMQDLGPLPFDPVKFPVLDAVDKVLIADKGLAETRIDSEKVAERIMDREREEQKIEIKMTETPNCQQPATAKPSKEGNELQARRIQSSEKPPKSSVMITGIATGLFMAIVPFTLRLSRDDSHLYFCIVVALCLSFMAYVFLRRKTLIRRGKSTRIGMELFWGTLILSLVCFTLAKALGF